MQSVNYVLIKQLIKKDKEAVQCPVVLYNKACDQYKYRELKVSQFSVQGEGADKHTTKMCGRESPREFFLGRLMITPGAQYFLSRNHASMWHLLRRYVLSDWGDVDKAAWHKSNEAVQHGERIHAEYALTDGGQVLVVTDAADENGERSFTILLLQKDYWILDYSATAH